MTYIANFLAVFVFMAFQTGQNYVDKNAIIQTTLSCSNNAPFIVINLKTVLSFIESSDKLNCSNEMAGSQKQIK